MKQIIGRLLEASSAAFSGTPSKLAFVGQATGGASAVVHRLAGETAFGAGQGAAPPESQALYLEAVDCWSSGKKKEALALALQARRVGHRYALMLLIKMAAAEGRNDEARIYLQEAIDHGLAPAKLYLAEVYEKGLLGLEQNTERAYNWYAIAAREELPEAMAALAYYHVHGVHVEQDEKAGGDWYRRAARRGHVPSMTAYGWMLAIGKGVTQDLATARRYLEKAERRGDKRASQFLHEFKLR